MHSINSLWTASRLHIYSTMVIKIHSSLCHCYTVHDGLSLHCRAHMPGYTARDGYCCTAGPICRAIQRVTAIAAMQSPYAELHNAWWTIAALQSPIMPSYTMHDGLLLHCRALSRLYCCCEFHNPILSSQSEDMNISNIFMEFQKTVNEIFDIFSILQKINAKNKCVHNIN